MPIAKAGDHGMNRKPIPREQMKDIVRAPCFDRVGCDRAGVNRQASDTTPPTDLGEIQA